MMPISDIAALIYKHRSWILPALAAPTIICVGIVLAFVLGMDSLFGYNKKYYLLVTLVSMPLLIWAAIDIGKVIHRLLEIDEAVADYYK
jgi:ABC-type transport system involved in cytochrome c biogenesis permease component